MSARRPYRSLLAILALIVSTGVLTGAAPAAAGPAVDGDPTPLSPELADTLVRSERFRHLAAELRCLVCQNQTLADSNAELAADLRNEVLRQMAAGKDDAQIKTHLVERFGEFVLYRPSFSAHNLALWAGPAVLALIGAVALWRISRRPVTNTPQAIDEVALRRMDDLLDDDPGPRR